MNEQQTNAPAELTPPAGLTLPNYSDGSIANIAPTIAQMLGVPFQGMPVLRSELWQPLGDDIQRVVLFLIDGFGKNLLRPDNPQTAAFTAGTEIIDQVTSVFPSTTVNAMSAVWTGSAPAHHGLVGLNILFPEFGTIGQTIHWTPAFQFRPEALVQAGQNPKHFLRTPGVGQQFARASVPVYALKSYQFDRSALSLMHGRGVKKTFPCINMSDIVFELRELLESKPGKKMLAVGYWHTVDTLSHKYGPHHPAIQSDLGAILEMIQRELIEQLSPAARAGTALIITGDHGQVHTPLDKTIHYEKDKTINEMLLMRPAGEPRVPYLFARQGAVVDLLDYLGEQYAAEMWALHAEEAIATGLFGPMPHLPELRQRIGDVVAVMRADYTYKLAGDVERAFLGTHGSLSPDEMEIAWLARRLDR
ncbi:MAG: alkaline phosphatase family protein [Anaerolineales bacterium]|nr:alkaline phosphatase family protein [Anaerolineales bacterium]